MTRKLIKAPPTKNTLLNFKQQLKFLEEGYVLLERKRELLTRLVYERIGEYRQLKSDTHRSIKEAYRWLSLAQLRMGHKTLSQASLAMEPVLDINILPRRAIGVEYPSVNVEKLPLKPVGLLGTDPSFDEAREQFADMAKLLARLGEAEMSLGRLIAEQRKAQKRVNALRYNIIPRYRDTIRFIENALEEEERNTLFQVKVLRDQNRI